MENKAELIKEFLKNGFTPEIEERLGGGEVVISDDKEWVTKELCTHAEFDQDFTYGCGQCESKFRFLGLIPFNNGVYATVCRCEQTKAIFRNNSSSRIQVVVLAKLERANTETEEEQGDDRKGQPIVVPWSGYAPRPSSIGTNDLADPDGWYGGAKIYVPKKKVEKLVWNKDGYVEIKCVEVDMDKSVERNGPAYQPCEYLKSLIATPFDRGDTGLSAVAKTEGLEHSPRQKVQLMDMYDFLEDV